MKTFENWYTNILEEVATAPAKSLSGDVDTIINSLGTLVKELTEELDSPEFSEVNEADKEGPSKVMQWIWWMPKARKAQQKVNKIKLNITDIESAAADAPDAKQKAKINAKATQSKKQADELQKMVDDKYGAKGDLVKRALHSEKIAGQITSIKRATGLEDNPEKIASYKEKMAELQKKYKEDQEAIKELEPSEEDKKAEKEKKQKELDDKAAADKEAKDKQAELDAEAKKGKKGDTEETDGKKTPEEIEAEKNKGKTPEEIEAEKNKGKDGNTEKIATKTAEIKQLKSDLAAEKEKETPDADKVAEIEGKIQTANKELEDLEASPATNDSLVIRAKAAGLNELASEIASKFDWQVSEGTVLYQKYDVIIKKAEYSNTLNESRYQNLSVKDRFSRLL